MDVKSQQGMVHLIARCPDCQMETLYCGKIESKISDLNGRELLFCKSCKFVVPVTDFKKILLSK